MENKTYNYEYPEITDNLIDEENAGYACIAPGCLFRLSSPIIILAMITFVIEWVAILFLSSLLSPVKCDYSTKFSGEYNLSHI